MTERTRYLSADEVQAAQALHKRAPFAICNVSQTQFSIARHFGGIVYQGCRFTYLPPHDECVRDDVLVLVRKMRRSAKRAAAAIEAGKQAEGLFGACANE